MADQATFMVGAAQASLEEIKGDIVTQTLDKLNPIGGTKKKSSSSKYAVGDVNELSKSVLSAAYDAKGIGIDTKS